MRQIESQFGSIAATTALFLSTLATNEAFTTNPARPHEFQNTKSTNRLDTHRLTRQPTDHQWSKNDGDSASDKSTTSLSSRRLFALQVAGTGSLLFLPKNALAGIDVSSLKNLPLENDVSGAATRLKQLHQQGIKVEPEESSRASLFSGNPYALPFTKLDSGVSYRDVKAGREGRKVQKGSTVGVEMSIRCKSSATANEPGGLKYFSTKEDTDYNELVWKIGSGDFVRGVEEGMMGMTLNAVRLIEVPSRQIFAARNAGVLPEPKTEDGKQIYENVFKTDPTLVFEVFVTAINQGNNRI